MLKINFKGSGIMIHPLDIKQVTQSSEESKKSSSTPEDSPVSAPPSTVHMPVGMESPGSND